MNKKAKPYLKGVLIAVLIILLQVLIIFGGLFFSCRSSFNPHNEYIDGYFQYIIVNGKKGTPTIFDKKYVAIIGFSALGKEQEIMDIPREIGGIEVRYIGYRKNETFTYSTYYFGSENLKKVYIHENIEWIYEGAFTQTPLEEVMLCAAKDPNLIWARGYMSEAKKYVYKSVYESHRICRVANIVFRINYLTEINDGYYSLDNIKVGETIPQPAKPEREGYEFTGWYTEANCENLWDFNVSPEIKEGEEFRLYAGWRRL